MNAHQLARTAYSSATGSVRTPRATEYDAFARVTHRLKAASDAQTPVARLAEALHDNGRLWTLLAGHVSDDTNELPVALRAQIFYLAEFTQQHSRKVLSGDGDLNVLIDINTAVMRGLGAREATP